MRVAAKGIPVLELDQVTKSYAGVVAVKDVSFCVRSGTIHALIGPNGAGKSTLINVIRASIAGIPDPSAISAKTSPASRLTSAPTWGSRGPFRTCS